MRTPLHRKEVPDDEEQENIDLGRVPADLGCKPTVSEDAHKGYIFRWKSNGICVTPSRRKTESGVWNYASQNLIPAFEPPLDPMKYVKTKGEVIPYDDEQ